MVYIVPRCTVCSMDGSFIILLGVPGSEEEREILQRTKVALEGVCLIVDRQEIAFHCLGQYLATSRRKKNGKSQFSVS